jgi:hypothetical protein
MNRQPSEVGPGSAADDVGAIETHVQSRLRGRVREFRLVESGGRLVLLGQARTYYAKQLAQQAVLEATDLPIAANEIEVR